MNVRQLKSVKKKTTLELWFFKVSTSNVHKIIGNHDYLTTSFLSALITMKYMRI